jgi:hypothetical protein
MRSRVFLGIAAALAMIAGSFAGTPTRAADDICAAGAPTDAVVKLPAPLSKWGQLICTPLGYVLTGHKGWVWMQPADHSLVIIPAQLSGAFKAQNRPATDGTGNGKAYFTHIEVTKVDGPEFDKAYAAFHDGFDPNEQKPSGYRLDLQSADGNSLTMYLFDYFTYGWGIACPDGACDRSTRFMMLDMSKRPAELSPPI